MTVEEALKFFEDIPNIYDRLRTLMDVGLGYISLGQSATTLSGGEAQRVKISSELYRPTWKNYLFFWMNQRLDCTMRLRSFWKF